MLVIPRVLSLVRSTQRLRRRIKINEQSARGPEETVNNKSGRAHTRSFAILNDGHPDEANVRGELICASLAGGTNIPPNTARRTESEANRKKCALDTGADPNCGFFCAPSARPRAHAPGYNDTTSARGFSFGAPSDAARLVADDFAGSCLRDLSAVRQCVSCIDVPG